MRLVAAEILKLRRRRGLMIWSVILTLGPVVVPLVVLLVLHAVNPDKHGPAGGIENLRGILGVLSLLGGLAGILIGTTAGSQDVSAGVFRDLAVTGRPRKTLFGVRAPGALCVYLPLMTLAFAIAAVATIALAGEGTAPDAGEIGGFAVAIGSLSVLNVVLGVSLASVASSRVAVGVLIAWNAVLAPILLQINALGGARKAVYTAAAEHFVPVDGSNTPPVTMSTGTALLVIALWLAIPLWIGASRTVRRDA